MGGGSALYALSRGRPMARSRRLALRRVFWVLVVLSGAQLVAMRTRGYLQEPPKKLKSEAATAGDSPPRSSSAAAGRDVFTLPPLDVADSTTPQDDDERGGGAEELKINFHGRTVYYTDRDLTLPVSSSEALEQIRGAMIHAWDGYKRFAWGHDELRPLSRRPKRTFGDCTAITILDAADTLLVMGLEDRFRDARGWIRNVNFSCIDESVSVFETTIRSFGALLSLYDLTNDRLYLEKAEELGGILQAAYENDRGISAAFCSLGRRTCRRSSRRGLAEVGTQQLEWRALGYHTKKEELIYTARLTESVMLRIIQASPGDSLTPYMVRTDSVLEPGAEWMSARYTVFGKNKVGAIADSYFEYLLKLHLQSGASEREGFYRREFERQVNFFLRDHLSKDWPARINGDMEHLACFLPGAMALALLAPNGSLSASKRDEWLKAAADLTESCYLMYYLSPKGLSSDLIDLDPQHGRPLHTEYMMRPEAIEAMFYLWRLTKEERYRAWAWKIFQSIQTHSKQEHGYSGLHFVYSEEATPNDNQESFFLAETLKYLFLLFSEDDVFPLDEWVFNTEAHPMKIRPDLTSTLTRRTTPPGRVI